MSFYVRKFLRVGPLRFNLSKSGIGVSAGFRGFRVGTGPRGNYVHMGRNGLYYRATLPSGSNAKRPPGSIPPHPEERVDSEFSIVEMKEIESVDILQLQDSSSSDLLAEINSKHRKIRSLPIAATLAATILIVLAYLRLQIWLFAVAIPIAGAVMVWTYYRDQLRKTTVLFFELDSDAEAAYQCLHDAFNELAGCHQAWHVAASGEVTDSYTRKRQAGATSLVRRDPTRLAVRTPPYVSTNVSVPSIAVGEQTLYFFPDRILVYASKGIGAVLYSDTQLQYDNTRFIETQGVPNDTEVVDHTWQYVNKDGSPDKRFKANRQLPIVLYSEVHFRSSAGLNALVQFSKPNLGTALADALAALASIQKGVSGSSD